MGNKRAVEAFGRDDSSESRGAVSTGKVPARGVQTDARGKLTDESRTGNSKRVVRAFHDLPRSSVGGLQKDHARGDRESRQNAETGEFMTDGGNSAGRSMKSVFPSIVGEFQGRSGQPDNQSINRGKGRT